MNKSLVVIPSPAFNVATYTEFRLQGEPYKVFYGDGKNIIGIRRDLFVSADTNENISKEYHNLANFTKIEEGGR
nr:5254_t:CDS:2 [Entrophospora candida]